MGHIPNLDELALVVGVGVVVALALRRLHLPTVAGLITAGALVGPHGLGLLGDPGAIDELAEVGVVLLLFTVGLEFSLARFRFIARLVLLGGALQVGLTVAAVAGAALAVGRDMKGGIFLGCMFALSSTAIVLKVLGDRGELEAPHGRLVLGVLIFQDLSVVPMMLLVPFLAGEGPASPGLALALAFAKAAGIVVLVLGVARLFVPRFLSWVAATRSRELFLLAILTFCSGIAWLTSKADLSLALGAFLAGMLLADTHYAQRALGDTLPLRDIFSSLFFMSMGMLFDVRVLFEDPIQVTVLFVGLVLGKGFIATLAALAMKFPARVAWLAGVALAQFGEFGFVLASMGASLDILDATEIRQVLAAGALSMFLTPVLVRVAPQISAGQRLLRPLERLMGARGIDEPAPEHQKLSGHAIIGGYGTGGRLLGQALRESGVPYLALDLDIERLRKARENNEPVYYGDVTSPEALSHARLDHARLLVLLVDDAEAAQRAVSAARGLAPEVPILVRSRGAMDADLLQKLGASNVVSERVESGVEMIARALRRMNIPGNLITEAVRQARAATQSSDRRPRFPRPRVAELEELGELKVESFLVQPGMYAIERSLAELDLRRQTGTLVVAMRRGAALVQHPNPHLALGAGDVLFLAGEGAAIRRADEVLRTGEQPEEPSGEIDLQPHDSTRSR